MGNREKDPLESQVRILFGRAGGRCSYPECSIQLVVPSRAKGDKPKNVAKIAHITAASADGPRYDPSLTSEERRSEPNLMLLCGTHHDAIDDQLHLHTKEWLLHAKAEHERTLDRGHRYAMGLVGYAELQRVCGALVMPGAPQSTEIESIDLSLDIDEKIALNRLGPATRELIELGMAQDREVRKFIREFEKLHPGFAEALTARFKMIYYGGMADRLPSDALFEAVLGAAYENCGPHLSDKVSAAALAVVAHLFSICEIFEHAPVAAG